MKTLLLVALAMLSFPLVGIAGNVEQKPIDESGMAAIIGMTRCTAYFDFLVTSRRPHNFYSSLELVEASGNMMSVALELVRGAAGPAGASLVLAYRRDWSEHFHRTSAVNDAAADALGRYDHDACRIWAEAAAQMRKVGAH